MTVPCDITVTSLCHIFVTSLPNCKGVVFDFNSMWVAQVKGEPTPTPTNTHLLLTILQDPSLPVLLTQPITLPVPELGVRGSFASFKSLLQAYFFEQAMGALQWSSSLQ